MKPSIKIGYEEKSAEEVSYWAGFFDGEGAIYIGKHHNRDGFHKSPTYSLFVHFSHNSLEQLEKFRKFFGVGNITKSKTAYYFGAKGPSAIRIIESLYPFLHLKRKQGEVGMAFQDCKRSYGSRTLPPSEISFREIVMNFLRELNA